MDKLIIHHDPYALGEDFEIWLKNYKHSLLILNVKEEGLEQKILRLLSDYNIKDFFFLDQSFPFLIRTSSYEPRCSIRVSEYETFETALKFPYKVDWIWFDTFEPLTLLKYDISSLKNSGFKICLVSPELQGREPVAEISEIREYIHEKNLQIDAVCTKLPALWNHLNVATKKSY